MRTARLRAFALALSVAASAAGPIPDGLPQAAAPEAPPGLGDRDKLTGDWDGARTRLDALGISVEPTLIVDFSKNTRGGRDTGGSAFRQLFSLGITLDLEKLAHLPGAKAFLNFQNQAGQNGSDETGDYQFVGNWDADGLTQISELWFEYECLDGKLRTKVGKIDANWEFSCSELGFDFVHGSASFPATNLLLPTYPDPATGVCVFCKPTDHTSLSLGLFDGAIQEGIRTGARGPGTFFGAPSDLFLMAEVGVDWSVGAAGLPGRFTVGAWHHTGTFDRYDGGQDHGTSGYTLILDQMIWLAEPATADEPASFESRGVGIFVMYDSADADVLPADHHVDAGVLWRGPVSSRPTDLIGASVSWIHFSDEPDAGFIDSSETAYELMYKAYVTPAASIQPYAQYIVTPGGAGLRDAVNVGVRVAIAF